MSVILILGLLLVPSIRAKSQISSKSAQEEKSRELFVVIVNDKRGFIDRNGKIVIEPQFNGARNFSEGLAVVATSNNGYAEGYIDETARIVIEPQFDKALDFSDGLAAVGRAQDRSIHTSYKWGYIDRAGKLIIEQKYIDTLGFSEGLAAVEVEDGRWGYIDRQGEMVMAPRFSLARRFSEGWPL
jgi:hypothetical protein